jgi:glycine cleavage system regulatory protein
MRQPLIITFTGPDRPGVVDRLAGVVSQHGGNWEESRMARLAGSFAGIVLRARPITSCASS